MLADPVRAKDAAALQAALNQTNRVISAFEKLREAERNFGVPKDAHINKKWSARDVSDLSAQLVQEAEKSQRIEAHEFNGQIIYARPGESADAVVGRFNAPLKYFKDITKGAYEASDNLYTQIEFAKALERSAAESKLPARTMTQMMWAHTSPHSVDHYMSQLVSHLYNKAEINLAVRYYMTEMVEASGAAGKAEAVRKLEAWTQSTHGRAGAMAPIWRQAIDSAVSEL